MDVCYPFRSTGGHRAVKRRTFIAGLGGAAAWPVMARAQPAAGPLIGYLSSRSPDDTPHLLAAFRRGLHQTGFDEGQNVRIEYRWALGQYDRLASLAEELLRLPIDMMVSTGGDPVALAAKNAIGTSNIPLVFALGSDPVKLGLTKSYSQPGGNATGINLLTSSLEAKRIGLLHELVPDAVSMGYLMNPNYAAAEDQLAECKEAARVLGLRTVVIHASADNEVDAAFGSFAAQGVATLAVGADPFFDTRRAELVALAAQHRLPAGYQSREYAAAGGLMSYGIDFADIYRQVGIYTGTILKGKKPSDLPVAQPIRFQFVLNLPTARTLGIEVPANLLARADEVIE
jgi:putative tryptophan/tyrosine transport system substrate-binding protein